VLLRLLGHSAHAIGERALVAAAADLESLALWSPQPLPA
jgi:hypothetical protein